MARPGGYNRLCGLSALNFHTHRVGGTHSRAYIIHGDLPSRKDKEIFLKVKMFARKLYRLARQSERKPIVLIIRSYGGSVDTELFLGEVLVHRLRPPIYTVADRAFSAAAIIFIEGAKGCRYVLAGGDRIMLHNATVRVWYEAAKPANLLAKFLAHAVWLCLMPILLILAHLYAQRSYKEMAKDQADMIYQLTEGNTTMLQRLGDWQEENDREEIVCGIMRLLEEGQYFTAEEAIACGLADEIIEDKKQLKELIAKAS